MKHVAKWTLIRPAAVLAAGVFISLSSLASAQGQGAPTGPPGMHGPAQPKPLSPAQIKSEGSYSLGLSMGSFLKRASVTPSAISMDRMMQGLRDALSGKVTFGPTNDQALRALILGARTRVSNANHAAAHTFLARNGKKKGVVTTASGLQYEVLTAGQGTPPKSGDMVVVNYRGSLLNGTVFDDSYKRGQPVTFPVDHVIPGWQEALKLMKPGAKWRVFIPPQLAYDLNPPMGAPIPPGSMLIFDVDLLKVQPAPAPPMMPQGPRPSPPPGQPHP